MTTSRLDSYAGLDARTLTVESGNHRPDQFTDKKRREIKNAFRLAINRSRTHDEAIKLTKLREKFFQPGGMTEDEAIIAWLEVTLLIRPGRPGQNPQNGRFHVSAA